MIKTTISEDCYTLYKSDTNDESLEIRNCKISILLVETAITQLEIRNSVIGRIVFNRKLTDLTIVNSTIEEKIICPASLRFLKVEFTGVPIYTIEKSIRLNPGLQVLKLGFCNLNNLKLPSTLRSLTLEDSIISFLSLNEKLRSVELDNCSFDSEFHPNDYLFHLTIKNPYGREDDMKLPSTFIAPKTLKSLSLTNVNYLSLQPNVHLESINLNKCAKLQSLVCNDQLKSLQIDRCLSLAHLTLNDKLQSVTAFDLSLCSRTLELGAKLKYAIFSKCNFEYIKINNKLRSLYVSTEGKLPIVDKTEAHSKLSAAFDLV